MKCKSAAMQSRILTPHPRKRARTAIPSDVRQDIVRICDSEYTYDKNDTVGSGDYADVYSVHDYKNEQRKLNYVVKVYHLGSDRSKKGFEQETAVLEYLNDEKFRTNKQSLN